MNAVNTIGSRFRVAAAALAAAVTAACGGSPDPGVDPINSNVPAELVGAWNTSCSVVTDPLGVFDPVNLVARGRTFTLSLGSDGRYSRSDLQPDKSVAGSGGTFSVTAPGFIDFTPDGAPTFRWAYTVGNFALSFTYSDPWDFGANGSLETGDFLIEMNGTGRDPVCSSIPVGLPAAWVATSIDVSDAANQLELISAGGAFSLDLTAGGSFKYSFTDVGAAAADTAVGFYVVSGTEIFLDDIEGESSDWEFALANNMLRLMFSDTYDLDGDGVEEPAAFDVTMTKP